MIVFQSSCQKQYAYFEIKASLFNKNNDDVYEVIYTSVEESPYIDPFYLRDFEYDKYNVNYILVGDVLKVKTNIITFDPFPEKPKDGYFKEVKKVKVKRAPIEHFEVSEYIDNGVYRKQIVCEDESIKLGKTYNDQNEVIITETLEIDKYKYTTLNELSVGTKLAATYYEYEYGINVYAFYLKSYIDNVTSK